MAASADSPPGRKEEWLSPGQQVSPENQLLLPLDNREPQVGVLSAQGHSEPTPTRDSQAFPRLRLRTGLGTWTECQKWVQTASSGVWQVKSCRNHPSLEPRIPAQTSLAAQVNPWIAGGACRHAPVGSPHGQCKATSSCLILGKSLHIAPVSCCNMGDSTCLGNHARHMVGTPIQPQVLILQTAGTHRCHAEKGTGQRDGLGRLT